MFNQNSPIRKRIMESIDSKINEAEETYKQECRALDEKCEQDKINLVDTMVEGILGKVFKK